MSALTPKNRTSLKKAPLPPKIYLDNAASTPMDDRVKQALIACLSADGVFANSSSKDHEYGWQAAEAVEKARDQIANAMSCSSLDLIFTSGATESNNLAIRGLVQSLKKQNDPRTHIITSPIEHKAVIECCELLKEDGFSVSYIKPNPDGTITQAMLEQELQKHPNTALVSIAHANSVLGTINDIEALAQCAQAHQAFFHSDLAQSNALIPLNLEKSAISLASLTPEKIYGPKGVGALYIKRNANLNLCPLIVGGGHEKGLRGGTLATHQIVAMGEAFAIMHKEHQEVSTYVSRLRKKLKQGLSLIEGVQINECTEAHLPNILSISFKNIQGQLLIPSLQRIACSTGSACSSKELVANYVLLAIGLSEPLAKSSLRLSLSRFTQEHEIDEAIQDITQAINTLRLMAN